MLANPPPLTKPQVDGLRFRHPWMDQTTLFVTQVTAHLDQLTIDALRLAQEVLTATNSALAYRIAQGNLSVHELSYLMGQKRIASDMNVVCGLQQPIAGHGYTINITQRALSALESILGWDPVLQVTPGFDVLHRMQQVYDGLTVLQGGTTPPAVQKQIDYLYRIRQLDDLPSIAAKITGSAANWQAIATYNQLRAPYISDNPQDQYGNPLTQGTLSASLAVGSSAVSLPGANAQVITQGTLLYLQTLGASGPVYEALPVLSFDQSTYVAALSGSTANAYPQGATWIIFPVPMDVTTKVLAVGGLLHIPQALATTSNQVTTPDNFLGTDIALAGGQVSFANGDLQTVSGSPNLQQALQNRFRTPQGADPYHPTYGSKLPLLIGDVNEPHYSTLAKLYVRETAMQDPRIADVLSSAVARAGNATTIAVQAKINNSNAVLAAEVVT